MHLDTGSLILLFVAFALLLGALTRYLLRGTRIPYTVALLLLGLLLGALQQWPPVLEATPLLTDLVQLLAHMDPHLILFVFLPTLIFESAFSMEVHLFRRLFGQICLLAVPGLLIASLLTAVLVKFAFPWEWSWPLALMFGALISATDPVAVVALLKEVSSRKRLETLIEGESLLNDGAAIVLFTLFFTLALAPEPGGFSLLAVTGSFGWVVLAGLGVGLLLGALALLWIGRVFNDPVLEIAVSIAIAYLCYFFSEQLGVSGVVALVALALLFAGPGRTRISPEVHQFLKHFWEMMAYVANTLIFLLVGILIAARVVWDEPQLWLALLGLYLSLQLIRGCSVLLLRPLLKRVGVELSVPKTKVLIWCGLRGAVSLALVLTVAQESAIPAAVRDQMLFLCAGIVVLTVVVNGASMEWLLNRLGMASLPPAKQATLDRARAQIQEAIQGYLPELKREPLFREVDWQALRPDSATETEAMVPASVEDQLTAYQRRLLEVERQHYWYQFHLGTLSQNATNLLVKAVEQALDGEPQIGPRPMLHPYWRAPRGVGGLRNYPGLARWMLRFSFERLSLGYEVARGFELAQEALDNQLEELAPDKEAAANVAAQVLLNKRDTLRYMDRLRASFPEVVRALESRSAQQLLLNRERQVIEELTRKAVLAEPEAEKLSADLDRRCQLLMRAPASLPLPNHRQLLEAQPWLQGVSEKTLDCLSGLAEVRIYQHGELLCRQGDQHAALLVVVRGTVERYQEQDEAVLLLDSLGPGALLGVEALFYGRSPRTVRALGIVEVIWLLAEKLRPPMADDNRLGEQLMQLMERQHQAMAEKAH